MTQAHATTVRSTTPMRTLITLALLLTACASSKSGDNDTLEAGQPYVGSKCVIPTSGTWRVASTLTTAAADACKLPIATWDFEVKPTFPGLHEVDPSSCTHEHNDRDAGCHRAEAYVCDLADSRSGALAVISLGLDYQSDTTLTGTMLVKLGDGAQGCTGTYSVILTKE